MSTTTTKKSQEWTVDKLQSLPLSKLAELTPAQLKSFKNDALLFVADRLCRYIVKGGVDQLRRIATVLNLPIDQQGKRLDKEMLCVSIHEELAKRLQTTLQYKKEMTRGQSIDHYLSPQDEEDVSDLKRLLTIFSSFVDPIMYEIMIDPVILTSGHTYDAVQLARWAASSARDNKGRIIDPKTGIYVDPYAIPNHQMKQLIKEFLLYYLGVEYVPSQLPKLWNTKHAVLDLQHNVIRDDPRLVTQAYLQSLEPMQQQQQQQQDNAYQNNHALADHYMDQAGYYNNVNNDLSQQQQQQQENQEETNRRYFLSDDDYVELITQYNMDPVLPIPSDLSLSVQGMITQLIQFYEEHVEEFPRAFLQGVQSVVDVLTEPYTLYFVLPPVIQWTSNVALSDDWEEPRMNEMLLARKRLFDYIQLREQTFSQHNPFLYLFYFKLSQDIFEKHYEANMQLDSQDANLLQTNRQQYDRHRQNHENYKRAILQWITLENEPIFDGVIPENDDINISQELNTVLERIIVPKVLQSSTLQSTIVLQPIQRFIHAILGKSKLLPLLHTRVLRQLLHVQLQIKQRMKQHDAANVASQQTNNTRTKLRETIQSLEAFKQTLTNEMDEDNWMTVFFISFVREDIATAYVDLFSLDSAFNYEAEKNRVRQVRLLSDLSELQSYIVQHIFLKSTASSSDDDESIQREVLEFVARAWHVLPLLISRNQIVPSIKEIVESYPYSMAFAHVIEEGILKDEYIRTVLLDSQTVNLLQDLLQYLKQQASQANSHMDLVLHLDQINEESTPVLDMILFVAFVVFYLETIKKQQQQQSESPARIDLQEIQDQINQYVDFLSKWKRVFARRARLSPQFRAMANLNYEPLNDQVQHWLQYITQRFPQWPRRIRSLVIANAILHTMRDIQFIFGSYLDYRTKNMLERNLNEYRTAVPTVPYEDEDTDIQEELDAIQDEIFSTTNLFNTTIWLLYRAHLLEQRTAVNPNASPVETMLIVSVDDAKHALIGQINQEKKMNLQS